MYKLLNDGTTIKRLSDGAFIPVCEGNLDYKQFKIDVVGIGTTCVVGIDTVTTVDYTDARRAEYPSLEEQQDMQYWDAVNGTTTWKDKIAEVKAKYPKSQVGVTTSAPLPDWVVGIST
tara:strand:+ start:1399 stop:1752 length:354 start_codon:yes stop_codon:yes gene_type:complete